MLVADVCNLMMVVKETVKGLVTFRRELLHAGNRRRF